MIISVLFVTIFYILVIFFFFQAEDGIRDWSVTGVQTCALPICLARNLLLSQISERKNCIGQLTGRQRKFDRFLIRAEERQLDRPPRVHDTSDARSEERRVGKECRSWWSAYHYKKNKE